ncbi:uncharacterized protein LOC110806379 [Carica papaya]|uniref:uncharacterized protein LOC110806379 n=1 Tax=Carica papaya TaxID=3649 RepID=UPI000B8CE027|nr:uncharacterized protein LOC110806379 [Carica papaya]
MGWVWRDEPEDAEDSLAGDALDRSSGDRCSTRKIVRSQCKTEEVEPGRFVRKCEKTEEILRDCIGKPVEVLQSNREYTEDDVTDMVVNGSSPFGRSRDRPFDFPGLRNDIEAIERHFSGA